MFIDYRVKLDRERASVLIESWDADHPEKPQFNTVDLPVPLPADDAAFDAWILSQIPKEGFLRTKELKVNPPLLDIVEGKLGKIRRLEYADPRLNLTAFIKTLSPDAPV